MYTQTDLSETAASVVRHDKADMQRADAELAKLYARKDMMQDLGAKEGSAGMQR